MISIDKNSAYASFVMIYREGLPMAGPAVELAMKCLYDSGPKILRHKYYEEYIPKGKKKKVGVWMGRLQAAAGPHKSGGDPHIAGRALDVILFAKNATERRLAEQLCDLFADARTETGLVGIVYNHWEWGKSGSRFPRGGSKDAINQHETHIHLEWSSVTINKTDFSGILDGRLSEYFYDSNQEEDPYGPPPP